MSKQRKYTIANQFTTRILIISFSLYLQNCAIFSNISLPLEQTNIIVIAAKELADKQLFSKEGHVVTIYQKETGQLHAMVKENIPTGFSKTYRLPVYLDREIGLNLATLSIEIIGWQKQHIHVTRDHVHIGQIGLLGGGKDRKKKIKSQKTRKKKKQRK